MCVFFQRNLKIKIFKKHVITIRILQDAIVWRERGQKMSFLFLERSNQE